MLRAQDIENRSVIGYCSFSPYSTHFHHLTNNFCFDDLNNNYVWAVGYTLQLIVLTQICIIPEFIRLLSMATRDTKNILIDIESEFIKNQFLNE